MSPGEFDQQINRLKDCFGDRNYSEERMKVIWNEVKTFSNQWFTRVVDQMIGHQRYAPLLADFQEEIAKERERRFQLEKKQEKKDAHDFWEGTYHPDETKAIMKTIKDRIAGKVSDEDYDKFIKMLEYAAQNNPKVVKLVRCKTCEDSGYVFQKDEEGYEWTYRCYCEVGQKKSNKFVTWRNEIFKFKKGEIK